MRLWKWAGKKRGIGGRETASESMRSRAPVRTIKKIAAVTLVRSKSPCAPAAPAPESAGSPSPLGCGRRQSAMKLRRPLRSECLCRADSARSAPNSLRAFAKAAASVRPPGLQFAPESRLPRQRRFCFSLGSQNQRAAEPAPQHALRWRGSSFPRPCSPQRRHRK